ncbi:MAG: PxKF domain-containing protein, partial [Gaiellaceae bacterium]
SDETPAISSGTIATGDTANFSQAFATKTVGTGKTLIPSGSVSDGNSGNNYTVTFLNNMTGVISAKPLTVAGITAANKPWDGNTSATINTGGASLVGVVGGDAVLINTAGASGAFTSPNVGTCTVQISGLAIAGADSGNYSLTQPTATACIGAWYATGFYAPVGIGNSEYVTSGGPVPTISPVSTMWNTAKGGSTIPLKFNLYSSQGGAERTSVADVAGFTALRLTCATGEGLDEVDFVTTGSTSLRYDGSGGQFIQNWKTPTASTDQCYRVNVTFLDGSGIYAFFRLRK